MRIDRVSARVGLVALLVAFLLPSVSSAQPAAPPKAPPPPKYPALPSEIPAEFKPATDGFDHTRSEVMIPMRDGVKLHTVILVPRGAKGAPILLTRTPYDAKALTTHAQSSHLGPSLHGYDNADDVIVEGGYIRVVQDVRGKHGSEGDYVANRPLRGAAQSHARGPRHRHLRHHRLAGEERAREQRQGRDPGHLLRRLPSPDGPREPPSRSQGVGAHEPHGGRLERRRLVPQRRLPAGGHGLDLRPSGHPHGRGQVVDAPTSTTTTCTCRRARRASSDGAAGWTQIGFWRKIVEHPSYDSFWSGQAVDRVLAAQPLKRPRHARAQPLGPGGHLRRARRLQGPGAEGHEQRPGLPGDGPLVPRPGHRRREHAGRLAFRERHRALLPPRDPAPLPGPVPEGRRAQGRHRSRHDLRDGDQCLAAPSRLAGRVPQRVHGPPDPSLPAAPG